LREAGFFVEITAMKTSPLLLAFGALLALEFSAPGKELADLSSGCSIKIPESWELIPFRQENSYSIAARSPDKHEGISLFVTPTQAKTIDGAKDYIDSYKTYLESQKTTITNQEKRVMGGNTFVVLTTTQKTSAKDIAMTAWLTVANGLIYQICLSTTDPAHEADLDAAIKTFAILQ
jgi:hypothetical protein